VQDELTWLDLALILHISSPSVCGFSPFGDGPALHPRRKGEQKEAEAMGAILSAALSCDQHQKTEIAFPAFVYNQLVSSIRTSD
jgi:hypothetical protein